MGRLSSRMRDRWGEAVACWLIAAYIRLVHASSRWQIMGHDARDRHHEAGRRCIFAMWHARIALMPYAWPEINRHVAFLASAHRDGRLVIGTLEQFGMRAIPVDSKADGKGSGAVRRGLQFLKQGGHLGITPDGPRGPAMQVKEGVIEIAALSGAVILPVGYGVRRRIMLKSWDRFCLPLPFNRGLILWGEPIEVPRRADAATKERLRQRLEAEMQRLNHVCDAQCDAGISGSGSVSDSDTPGLRP